MAKLTLTHYINQGKQVTLPRKQKEEIERLFNKSIGESDVAIQTITTLFPNLSGENRTGFMFSVDAPTSQIVLIPIEQVKTAMERLLLSQAEAQQESLRDLGHNFDFTKHRRDVSERISSLLDFVVSNK